MLADSAAHRAEAVPARITRALRLAIDAGTYPVDTPLPSTRTMAANFQASPTAVREAIVTLEAEGRVISTHGKGIVVTGTPAPSYAVVYDPAQPWRDLTAAAEPRRTRGAADARTAGILGVPPGEHLHILDQAATHTTGARVRVLRVVPASAYDGMATYPDPMGPRTAINAALTETHGPLTYVARYGAIRPSIRDRDILGITGPGGTVLYAATVTRSHTRRGLILDTVHYNAAVTELTDTP
jgi:hypothetical protein